MLEIERVKADEGRRLCSGTGRVRTRVRVHEGGRQGADEGSRPRSVAVGCCKHYGASPDESRLSGSQNLAGLISEKNVYSRWIGLASAPFVPYVLNVCLSVLCVLNILNVRAS